MLKKTFWFHRCIAYYFYRWQLLVKNPRPELGAVCASTGWILVNIMNLNLIIEFIFNVRIIPHGLSSLPIIIFSFFALLLNYYYLMAEGRFERIKKEFINNSEVTREKEKKITIFYFSLSIVLFFVLSIVIT